jgi:hypothetical protein
MPPSQYELSWFFARLHKAGCVWACGVVREAAVIPEELEQLRCRFEDFKVQSWNAAKGKSRNQRSGR